MTQTFENTVPGSSFSAECKHAEDGTITLTCRLGFSWLVHALAAIKVSNITNKSVRFIDWVSGNKTNAFITGTHSFEQQLAKAITEDFAEKAIHEELREKLATLRMSIFRIATHLGVEDALLEISDETKLHDLVRTQEQGWNTLLLKIEELLIEKHT